MPQLVSLQWEIGGDTTTLSGRTDDEMINDGLDHSQLFSRAEARQSNQVPRMHRARRSHVTFWACPRLVRQRGFLSSSLASSLCTYNSGRTQLYPADSCSSLSRELLKCSSSHAERACLMILRRGQCLRNGDSPLSALLPHTPHPTLRPRIRRDFHGCYPARSRWPSRIRGRVTVGSRRGVVNTCDTREEPLKYSASAPWRVQIAILVAYDRGSSCLPPSPTRGTSRLSRR